MTGRMEGIYETKDLCIGFNLYTADIDVGRMLLTRRHCKFVRQSEPDSVSK
jgi:hypothetical protein